MTPAEILGMARAQYNAVGDTFFGDTELYNLIWRAEMDLGIQTKCLRDIQTTSTVVDQREYARPTNCISVKRIIWNGRKLEPSDFVDDDILTGYTETTSSTGTPLYYQEWKNSIFLRPTPNAVQTLKIYFYMKPTQVTAVTTLEAPEEYQLYIVDFLLYHMFSKDQKDAQSAYHLNNWKDSVEKIKTWERQKLRSDSGQAVKNLDAYGDLVGWIR